MRPDLFCEPFALPDPGDLDRGEELAMPRLATVALAAAVLVDDELLAPTGGNENLAGHLDARQRGGANLDVSAVRDQEHLIERHRALVGRAIQLLNLNGFAGLNPVLLTT